MSSANNVIYQITSLANPLEKLEIRGLAVKEDEFVISNIIRTTEWQEADWDATDRRVQFPFVIGLQYSQAQLLEHFQPLLLNDVNIYDAVKGININTAIPAVESLTISPSTVSKARPTTQQFTVAVEPEGADDSVTWSITSASGLTISQAGLVTIGAGTPAGNYTVTATSNADDSISDTATLTVTT